MIKCCIFLCTWWAYEITAIPMRQVPQTQLQQIVQVPAIQSSREFKESPRVLSSVFGSVIESLPFLPLNLNVPDALTGMYSLVTQYFGLSEQTTAARKTKKKKKKRKPTTTTTTTTTTPEPETEEEEEEEEEHENEHEHEQGHEPETEEETENNTTEEDEEEEESKRLTIMGRPSSNGFQDHLEEMLNDYIRRKALIERKKKHKKEKKRGKHKHDDMLHKIASHLAFLELEC